MKKSLLLLLFALLSVQAYSQTDLTKVKSWAYWLQNININEIVSNNSFELIVMDYSPDGEEDNKWTAQQINTVKNSGKYAIAYISIGEAEEYRFYWQDSWLTNPPAWLGPENQEWKGNYKVRFWNKDWQNIVFQYLDTIIAQGFDGIYMDIIDGYYYWSVTNPEQPYADSLMCQFVINIRKHCNAETGNNNFIILPQNGSDVWDQENVSAQLKDKYFDAIDGIGVEDVFFPGDKDINNNFEPDEYRIDILKQFTQRNKQVFAIDYLTDAGKIAQFVDTAGKLNFIPYSCTRNLDHLCNYITSINDIVITDDIKLTPNPAGDYIDISGDIAGEVRVYDVLGVCVLTLPCHSCESTLLRVNVSDLSAGVYFVVAGDKIFKFMKL